jgi:membrane protein
LKNFPVKWENYGIVGTFIIFMLWLNLLAILLLFGTAVNVSLDQLRYGPATYSNGPLAEFIAKRRKK